MPDSLTFTSSLPFLSTCLQGRIHVCSYTFGTRLKELDPHRGAITCKAIFAHVA